MSESKHTPSPWRSFPRHPTVWLDGKMVVDRDHPISEFGIVSTFHDASIDMKTTVIVAKGYITEGRGESEASANAQLIAAAPEMYEALRSLTVAHDDYCAQMAVDFDDPLGDGIQRARAALAKAEGKT